VRSGTIRVLEEAAGRSGHIFNLGHGVLPDSPLENVETMVETVVGWKDRVVATTSSEGLTVR
jgi:uroporphyrinogen decarboxylase